MRCPALAMCGAQQAEAMAAIGYTIVDEQLIDHAGRVNCEWQQVITSLTSGPPPRAFIRSPGPLPLVLVADGARSRLHRDMVGRRARLRIAPFQLGQRLFAAKVADHLVDRGDALARHDVDLAVIRR